MVELDIFLAEMEDKPVAYDMVMVLKHIFQSIRSGDLLEDLIIPSLNVLGIIGEAQMQYLLVSQQFVNRYVNQAGRFSNAFAGGKYPQIPFTQTTVYGFFKDPDRTSLEKLRFQHSVPL
jgi:hypothetical protein